MLAANDPLGARPFFERAVAAGNAMGMLGMARTFDPSVIGQDVVANPANAAAWYRLAAAVGNTEAAARLKQLERTR